MNTDVLLKKLIAAREGWVSAGRFRFKVRRPTEMELVRMRIGARVEIGLDVIRDAVVGWEGVTENDLVGSGSSDAVPFDAALYASWIEDRPELWQPIGDAIHAAIEAYQREHEADAKN